MSLIYRNAKICCLSNGDIGQPHSSLTDWLQRWTSVATNKSKKRKLNKCVTLLWRKENGFIVAGETIFDLSMLPLPTFCINSCSLTYKSPLTAVHCSVVSQCTAFCWIYQNFWKNSYKNFCVTPKHLTQQCFINVVSIRCSRAISNNMEDCIGSAEQFFDKITVSNA